MAHSHGARRIEAQHTNELLARARQCRRCISPLALSLLQSLPRPSVGRRPAHAVAAGRSTAAAPAHLARRRESLGVQPLSAFELAAPSRAFSQRRLHGGRARRVTV